MELKNDGWYKKDTKTGEAYCIAPPIRIVKKKVNIETDEVTIVIYDGRAKTREESMDILTSQKIEGLTKYGFGVTPKNKHDLSEVLIAQAVQMNAESIYRSVGLVNSDGVLNFQGAKLVSSNSTVMGTLSHDSNYDLEPKGSIENWIEMFQTHVTGTIKLELAVTLGVSGIVFRYLAEQGIDLINPIVHFSGDSSTGKTTAAQLALSVAGNPLKNKGLYKSWNNTDNAFFATIKDNYGIPMLFDEVSMYRGYNISQLIYQLADGNPRGRADKDGNLRKQPDAATIIFSTGEKNVTEHKTNSRNTGVGVRILEFEGAITSSALQSQEIKKFITKNYGHILPLIAEELLESNPDDIIEIFNCHYESLSRKLKNSSAVVERVTNFYAAILTAGTAFNETGKNQSSLNIGQQDLIDLNAIESLLVDHEKSSAQTRDLAEEVYESLIQYLIQNQHKISSGCNEYNRTRETIGHYEPTDTIFRFRDSSEGIKRFKIKMLKNEFNKFISDNNFEGIKKIQTALTEKNYIVRGSKDRVASQQIITTDGKRKREAFYHIVIPDEMLVAFNYSGIEGKENDLKPQLGSSTLPNESVINGNSSESIYSENKKENVFTQHLCDKGETKSNVVKDMLDKNENYSLSDDLDALDDIEI